MARKVKFPLLMPDGAVVRDPDELKLHFDLSAVLEYYENGKLAEWLDNCLYTEEATRVRELAHSSAPDLGQMLCDILGVAYTKPDSGEEASDRRKRLARLRQYTADETILAAVDHVAFSQEDLVKLLEKEPDIEEIYLCGERFAIPKDGNGITYIGVNHPQVYCPQYTSATVKQVEESYDGDEFKPEQLWRGPAEQGYSFAQYNLAMCYKNRNGVAGDQEEAFKWFLKAAEQGNVLAQNQLGCCYRDGKGIAEDQSEAFQRFLKAAEREDAQAQYEVALCYKNGYGVAKDEEKAFQWFLKAAEQEDARAQYNLALCYKNGKGVAKDQKKASQWFLKAEELGRKNRESLKRLW